MDLNEKIFKNGGYLPIKCIGTTRQVFLFDELLTVEESAKLVNHSPDGFNWGYNGSGPAQLALAILLKFLPKTSALKEYQTFKMAVVSMFPQGSFSGRINVNLFVDIVFGKADRNTIHAYELLDIEIGDGLFISKFIDFPNLPYKTADVDVDTQEAKLLTELKKNDTKWDFYTKYIEQETRRKIVGSEQYESASIRVCFDDENFDDKSFVYENGLGSQNYLGFRNNYSGRKNGK